MRIFEVLTLSTVFLILIILLLPRRIVQTWLVYLPWVGVIFVLVHLLVEGYRWQMVPAYALVGVALVLVWWLRRRVPPARKGWRLGVHRLLSGLGFLLAFLLWGVALALPILVPVFDLPEPTGPYAVGRTELYLVDNQRPELLTAAQDDMRELKVTVWYPAEVQAGMKPLQYWEEPRIYGQPLAQNLGLPVFIFDHLDLVKTHTYMQASLAEADGPFPIMIFSHGLNVGFAVQNSFMMEELASHGYVIFSIDHPYEGLTVAFSDGRRVFLDREHAQAMVDEVATDVDTYLESDPTGAQQSALQGLLASGTGFDDSIHAWVEDTGFVLEQLDRLTNTPEGFFSGNLDLEKVGLFGHSYGGATATLFCLLDTRCDAALNMDGLSFGHELLTQGLDVPYLMFYGDAPELTNARFNQFVFDQTENAAYEFQMLGGKHSDFTDFTLMSPVFRWVGFLGPNSGLKLAQSANAVVLAFLDVHLKGKPSTLLDDPGAVYPFVDVIDVRK